MDLSQIKIETERLLLVPVTQDYAEQIFVEYRDPVTTYMNYGSVDKIESINDHISETEKEAKNGEILSMAILLKDTKEFLGRFVLESLDLRIPEIGGWLKASAHGHRYGQEVAGALKEWADQNLDYDYLVWPCVSLNIPSRKLAESIGGKVGREYEKQTAQGKTWPYVDYWIPKKTNTIL